MTKSRYNLADLQFGRFPPFLVSFFQGVSLPALFSAAGPGVPLVVPPSETHKLQGALMSFLRSLYCSCICSVLSGVSYRFTP